MQAQATTESSPSILRPGADAQPERKREREKREREVRRGTFCLFVNWMRQANGQQTRNIFLRCIYISVYTIYIYILIVTFPFGNDETTRSSDSPS